MKRLAQRGFVAFKPTTRGTVTTLRDARIYDINESDGDRQTTNARPTNDHRAATNKNEKKEKNEKKYSPHSDEWRLAKLLWDRIVEGEPKPRSCGSTSTTWNSRWAAAFRSFGFGSFGFVSCFGFQDWCASTLRSQHT